MKITASNIVKAISALSKNSWFEYINEKTKTKVRIINITFPEGPIIIERYDPAKNQSTKVAKKASISAPMIRRVANAIQENIPFNLDRILGASYNTRSALEVLIAYTSEFYWCLPGRIELTESTTDIRRGHKHLVWLPDAPHAIGVLEKRDVEQVISESSSLTIYEALTPTIISNEIDIDVQRRHLQIQIALIMIGNKLGFRTWIAHNDQGLKYGDKRVGELDGVVLQLDKEAIMQFDNAVKAAMQIDCIWFRNGRFMPAVIEVEHTTGVTSGLSRMKNLQDYLPPIQTRWVIAAPDEDRDKVMREAAKPQFASLNVQFLPYSAVDELYGLCQRRHLNNRAVNEEFLDCFMEPARAY